MFNVDEEVLTQKQLSNLIWGVGFRCDDFLSETDPVGQTCHVGIAMNPAYTLSLRPCTAPTRLA